MILLAANYENKKCHKMVKITLQIKLLGKTPQNALTLAAPRGIGVALNPKGGQNGLTKNIVSMN